jgi:hypothetical protein
VGPWVAIAAASEVTVTLDRWRELVAPPPLEPAPAPFVERRDVVVRIRGDELVIDATFRVAVPEPGPVAFTVAGPELRVERFTVDGRETALGGGEGGPVFAAALRGPVTLRLVGAVTREPGATVSLLGAGAGELALPPELALVGGIALPGGRWVPAAPDRTLDALQLDEPLAATTDRGLLVFGRVGYGVTALDGELRRAARLQWRVVSGSLSQVSFTVPGAGPDLTVEGPQVGEVARSGDRVTVTLAGDESAIVDLVVRTSSALGAGELTTVDLGLPTLDGVFRSESTVVLARDGELDVFPRLQGLGARSVLRLPAVAGGLVDGTPSAAFEGAGGSGVIDVLRFTPAEGPATLCDVATYTMALTDDGRGLLQAHWTVRNDRGHLLRITPPPGYTPIAAQVSSRPVTVSRDGDTWLVPLDKSVESVAGLLTFPVEVAFLGAEPVVPGQRLRRPIALPTIDVETAVVRATVHLPPGFVDRSKPGEGDRVADFSHGEGITYGFAVGDVRAAQAESLWQSALASWNDNDFEGAQQALDGIGSIGGGNENTIALQGNLDVISGKKKAEQGSESSVDRRIKDQARARALSDFEEQRRLLEEAERATDEGRYDEAERAYGAASAVTEKLAKLANEEDVAQAEELELTQQKSQLNAETLNRKVAYRSRAVEASGDGDDRNAAGPDATSLRGQATVEVDEVAKGVAFDGAGGLSDGQFPASAVAAAPPPVTVTVTSPSAGDSGVLAIVEAAPVTGSFWVDESPPAARPAEPPSPPKQDLDDATRTGASRGPSRPAVVATTASVVVPTHGDAVRYQHLLLPAGERLSLEVSARSTNRRSRSSR